MNQTRSCVECHEPESIHACVVKYVQAWLPSQAPGGGLASQGHTCVGTLTLLPVSSRHIFTSTVTEWYYRVGYVPLCWYCYSTALDQLLQSWTGLRIRCPIFLPNINPISVISAVSIAVRNIKFYIKLSSGSSSDTCGQTDWQPDTISIERGLLWWYNISANNTTYCSLHVQCVLSIL